MSDNTNSVYNLVPFCKKLITGSIQNLSPQALLSGHEIQKQHMIIHAYFHIDNTCNNNEQNNIVYMYVYNL